MRTARALGFTLIEVMLASVIAATVFAAIYGVFSKAIHLREQASERTRELQLRNRAMSVLRDDLRNGYVSNGILAATMKGSATSTQSRFPGYLRFTTTTASMYVGGGSVAGGLGSSFKLGLANGDPASGDVQEVEYYIAPDPGAGPNAGALVRVVYHDLLSALGQTGGEPQTLLSGVSAMELSFYDGDAQTWTDSWDETNSGTAATGSSTSSLTSTATTSDTDPIVFTPAAVRVRLRGVADGRRTAPLLCEVLVPWLNEPWLPTPATQ